MAAVIGSLARAFVRAYFELSYRLLATGSGRRFLLAAAAPDVPVVHGYATRADLEAVIETIGSSPPGTIIDLGCGLGEVALEVHRRTGRPVLGIDLARRAIAEARRSAHRAGLAADVRFVVGDMTAPPVGGSAAYALDSLMFHPNPPAALGRAAQSLGPRGRILVTLVDHRRLDRAAFGRYIGGGGLALEQLDDVTPGLIAQSTRRAATARRQLGGSARPRTSSGLLLVLAEETLVAGLARRGWLRRWRFVVSQPRPTSPA